MKKIIKITALCLALACLLSISAFAAGTDVKKGVGPITNNISGITVTAGAGETGTVDGVTVTDTETLTLSYPGAAEGAQYMVFLLTGTEGAPTESSIAYIDQKAADASGVSFTIYPSELKKGDYRVILTSSNDSNVGVNTPVATFEYKQAYVPGDVNEDGNILVNDAQLVLNSVVGNVELTAAQVLAADVTGDGEVLVNDAQKILNFIVGNIEEL